MPKLLSLTKVTRLLGVKRSVLQKKIQSGELCTCEGMITVTELLRVYPETKIEDTAILERMERIKDQAFKNRRKREEMVLPTIDILENNLKVLSKELISVQSELERSSQLFKTLMQKFSEAENINDANLRSHIVALHDWLKTEMQRAPKNL